MDNTGQKSNNLKGKVITFYSYKGGVGRSMSLVNIACLMAKQKKKVLLIDWDLEAPGLHTFFGKAIKNKDLGLVDFITDVIKFIEIKNNDVEEKYEQFLTDHLHKYIQKDLNIENSGLQIDIIKSGKFDNNYTKKLNEINWMNFYKDSPAFFRTFAQFLEKKYDYILIDSRTGLADTSGVCTMLMPQILIPVFVLNNQNIDGVIEVIKQSVNYRFDSNDYRNITVLPLPSRIDEQYLTDLPIWIDKFKNKFEKLFKELYLLDECVLENYFDIAKIPYKPAYAYGENIPVLKEPVRHSSNNSSFISYHYAQFLRLIEDTTPIWEILSDEQLEINKKLANDYFLKGLEYQYAKEYEKAIIEYEKSIEAVTTNAGCYVNLGSALREIAITKKGVEKEKLLEIGIEKLETAISLDPSDSIAYNNLGTFFSEITSIKEGDEKKKYLLKSFNEYNKAIELDPKNYNAFNNLGLLLAKFPKIIDGTDKLEYLKKSIEKFQKSIELYPDFYYAYINWGNILNQLGKLRIGREKETSLNESIEKCRKGIKINPEFADGYHLLGNVIYELAKIKKGKEKEKLLIESQEILFEGIKLGSGVYNLSCLYAVWDKKDKALKYLEDALIKNEIPISHIYSDDDWDNYKEDGDFLKLLEKYKPIDN